VVVVRFCEHVSHAHLQSQSIDITHTLSVKQLVHLSHSVVFSHDNLVLNLFFVRHPHTVYFRVHIHNPDGIAVFLALGYANRHWFTLCDAISYAVPFIQ
jgi:hypothetical protein